MDDLKEEFGQNIQPPEQTELYSVLGIVWYLKALVHLFITTSYETGTLLFIHSEMKHLLKSLLPWIVKRISREKNSGSDECSEENYNKGLERHSGIGGVRLGR